jgi:hypothetical protein
MRSDDFVVRSRGNGEMGERLVGFFLSKGRLWFFLFPSNLLAIYFYLCVVPFSDWNEVGFKFVLIRVICMECYADASNALTRLLKCSFSRSVTLPSTLYH